MTSHYGRRIPPAGVARKRKERENPCFTSGSGPPAPNKAAHSADAGEAGGESKPMCSNRLLAGYMAHEFLTRGTLFGQTLEPGGAAPATSGSSSAKSHAEIMAGIVRSDGTHIPGVVNPSQLSRWMQS